MFEEYSCDGRTPNLTEGTCQGREVTLKTTQNTLSAIYIIRQYVPFQRKPKDKLRNNFNNIIEIVGNGAVKVLKCLMKTLSPTACEKQEDSGYFQDSYKNKAQFIIVVSSV